LAGLSGKGGRRHEEGHFRTVFRKLILLLMNKDRQIVTIEEYVAYYISAKLHQHHLQWLLQLKKRGTELST
jgi:hypothetical protein